MILPSNYRGDWYGWTANQLSHMALGLLFSFFACWAAWAVLGEFPVRWNVWVVLGLGYLAFELFTQGWNWADTVEDWLFFAAYGAGIPLLVFREMDPTGGVFVGQIDQLLPFANIVVLHLILGVAVRAVQRARGAGYGR